MSCRSCELYFRRTIQKHSEHPVFQNQLQQHDIDVVKGSWYAEYKVCGNTLPKREHLWETSPYLPPSTNFATNQGSRQNLVYNCNGEIVYPAACAGVVMTKRTKPLSHRQTYNLDHTQVKLPVILSESLQLFLPFFMM